MHDAADVGRGISAGRLRAPGLLQPSLLAHSDASARHPALEFHLGGEVHQISEGETLHTEHSHKYTVSGFQALAERAGFKPGKVWTDAKGWFAVLWLVAP